MSETPKCSVVEIMHACALVFGRDHFADIQELSRGASDYTITEKDIMVHLVALRGLDEKSVGLLMGIEPHEVIVSMNKVRERIYKKQGEKDLRVTIREISRVAMKIKEDGYEAARREIEDKRTVADLEFFIGDCTE